MPFFVIAHRGASAEAPDNTAAAFQLALDQQADMIETDVQRTQDGVLILEHDFEIGGRSVAASRLAELRQIKPDLLTVAAALVGFGRQIPLCWEVKTPGVETELVELVRDLLPPPMWQRTHFTSFFFGTAVMLRQLAPQSEVGWLNREWNEAALHQVAEAGLTQTCPTAEAVVAQPELVHTATALGLRVRVWGVTSPDLLPALVEAGVYGGTVNWPRAAREHILGHKG